MCSKVWGRVADNERGMWEVSDRFIRLGIVLTLAAIDPNKVCARCAHSGRLASRLSEWDYYLRGQTLMGLFM